MAAPRIDSYRFGSIVIDGRRYSRDVVIYPDHVDGHWWRKQGHSVAPSDLLDALGSLPAVLVIGQGSPGLMEVPDITRRRVEEAGIVLIVQLTAKASATYNRMREAQRVVAALHLTC